MSYPASKCQTPKDWLKSCCKVEIVSPDFGKSMEWRISIKSNSSGRLVFKLSTTRPPSHLSFRNLSLSSPSWGRPSLLSPPALPLVTAPAPATAPARDWPVRRRSQPASKPASQPGIQPASRPVSQPASQSASQSSTWQVWPQYVPLKAHAGRTQQKCAL